MEISRNSRYWLNRTLFGCVFGAIVYVVYHYNTRVINLFTSSNVTAFVVKQPSSVTYENVYSIPEVMYQQLSNLTNGNIRRSSITETVQILFYDVTQPVPESTKKFECTLLKNANPPYNVCLAPEGFFHNRLKSDFAWEPAIQSFIKKVLQDNPGTVFVDVGMNIGIHSLYATTAVPGTFVLGIEPLPESVTLLHKSAHMNKVQDRFTVVLGGVSNKREILGVPASDPAVLTLTKLKQGSPSPTLQISSTTMNDLAPLLKVKKALLKLDIESMECETFVNADKFFAEVDVKAIILEIGLTKNKGPCCFEAMLNFLKDRKFTAFYFDDHPQRGQPLDYANWRNWDFSVNVYLKKTV